MCARHVLSIRGLSLALAAAAALAACSGGGDDGGTPPPAYSHEPGVHGAIVAIR